MPRLGSNLVGQTDIYPVFTARLHVFQNVRKRLHHPQRNTAMQAHDILHFWFEELTPKQHFVKDPALVLAQEMVAQGQDRDLPVAQRAFVYLPYMHSESALIHQQAVRLFSQPDLEYNLDFERRHQAIIERFGRYPHRNAILGRTSSAEESVFLSEPGSSF